MWVLNENFLNDTLLKQKENFEVSYYFFYDTYIISSYCLVDILMIDNILLMTSYLVPTYLPLIWIVIVNKIFKE